MACSYNGAGGRAGQQHNTDLCKSVHHKRANVRSTVASREKYGRKLLTSKPHSDTHVALLPSVKRVCVCPD